MKRSLFLLALLCAPAFAGPITTYASYSDGSYASASSSEDFTGTGSLVTLRTRMWVTSSWIEHRPRQPPESGWDHIYHPGGTASAGAGDTFQVIAGTAGTGRIEADVTTQTSCCGSFSIALAGAWFFPGRPASALEQFSAPIPLGQPFAIDMQLRDYILQGGSSLGWSVFELKALRFYDANGQAVDAQLGIPEPGTVCLTISGLLALYGWKRRRDRSVRGQTRDRKEGRPFVKRSLSLLALLCAPAFAGPIYTQSSWTGEGSYAYASGSESFTGTGPLVMMYTQMATSTSWTEHRPRQPLGSGWDIIYHPGGTASAVVSDTFEVIAGTEGIGRIDADVVTYSEGGGGQFSMVIAGSPLLLGPIGAAVQRHSVPIPLGQPFMIDMELSEFLSDARGERLNVFELKALRFYDANGQAIDAQLGIPEPGTVYLTISGLLALYGWKRRRDRSLRSSS